MTWDDFAPYVLPYAPGCPDATMEHHARLAAIDFCRHTHVWQQDLTQPAADGVSTDSLFALPTGSAVSKLLSAAASIYYSDDAAVGVALALYGLNLATAGLPWPAIPVVAAAIGTTADHIFTRTEDLGISTAADGAQQIRDGSLQPIAFTADLRTLTVWPAPALAASIVATVSLKPSMTAATFPDALFAHYAQDIAAGALSTILALPKKDWTDMPAAGIADTKFRARMSVVARAVERGFAKSGRRSSTRWF